MPSPEMYLDESSSIEDDAGPAIDMDMDIPSSSLLQLSLDTWESGPKTSRLLVLVLSQLLLLLLFMLMEEIWREVFDSEKRESCREKREPPVLLDMFSAMADMVCCAVEWCRVQCKATLLVLREETR